MWFWNVREEWHAHNNPSRVQKAVPNRNAEKESKKKIWAIHRAEKMTMNKGKKPEVMTLSSTAAFPLQLFTSADYFSSTFDFWRLTQCLWHSDHFVNLSWAGSIPSPWLYAGGICEENNDHVWPVYECGIFFNIHTQAWTSRSSSSYRETLHLFPLSVLSA